MHDNEMRREKQEFYLSPAVAKAMAGRAESAGTQRAKIGILECWNGGRMDGEEEDRIPQ